MACRGLTVKPIQDTFINSILHYWIQVKHAYLSIVKAILFLLIHNWKIQIQVSPGTTLRSAWLYTSINSPFDLLWGNIELNRCILFPLEFEVVLECEGISERGPKIVGKVFRRNGLMAGAEAQQRPVFTSTALQTVILYETPGFVNNMNTMGLDWAYMVDLYY